MSEDSRLGRETIETAHALKQLVTAGVRVFFHLDDRDGRTRSRCPGRVRGRTRAGESQTAHFRRPAAESPSGARHRVPTLSLPHPTPRRAGRRRRIGAIVSVSGLDKVQAAGYHGPGSRNRPRPQLPFSRAWRLSRFSHQPSKSYMEDKLLKGATRPATRWHAKAFTDIKRPGDSSRARPRSPFNRALRAADLLQGCPSGKSPASIVVVHGEAAPALTVAISRITYGLARALQSAPREPVGSFFQPRIVWYGLTCGAGAEPCLSGNAETRHPSKSDSSYVIQVRLSVCAGTATVVDGVQQQTPVLWARQRGLRHPDK
jgi:hypothetical protein